MAEAEAPAWAEAIGTNAHSKIYVIACRGFVKAWVRSGRSAHELPPPPRTTDDAYRLWFELQPPSEAVQRLLGLTMAAREPLSSAQLDSLGLLAARDGLPGWGLLFEDREHLLQTLHLTLREFLLDASRSGLHAADWAGGHVALARSCLKVLCERSSGPTLAYALRHGHIHLTAVVATAGAEATAVLREWFEAFLEPRGPGGGVTDAGEEEPVAEGGEAAAADAVTRLQDDDCVSVAPELARR